MAKLFGRFDRAASAAASIGAARPSTAEPPRPESPRGPRATISDVDTREVPLSLIVPDPGNARGEITPESVADLAESFKTNGQAVSCLAYQRPGDERFYLIFGHRRFAAATLNGWSALRCEIVFDPTLDQIAAWQLIENAQRDNLTPLQEARDYAAKMADRGWTQAQLCEKTRINQSRVAKRLALLDLAPHVQGLIDRGELEWSRAYELRKLKDHGQQAEVADLAVLGEWTGAHVKGAVERRLGGFTGPLPGQATLPIAADPPAAQADPIAEEPAHVTETPYSAGMESAPLEAPEADAWTPPPDPPTPAQELRREIRKARDSIATAGETPGGYQVATGVRIVKPSEADEPHPIDRHLDRVARIGEPGPVGTYPPADDAEEELAGWSGPGEWGDLRNFVFDHAGADAVLTLEARSPAGWRDAVAILEEALAAARWRAELAAVEGGPARPGDLVEVIDPASDLAGVLGIVEADVLDGVRATFRIAGVGVVSEARTFAGAELRRDGASRPGSRGGSYDQAGDGEGGGE